MKRFIFIIICIIAFQINLLSQSIEISAGLLYSQSIKIGDSRISKDDLSHADFPITLHLNLNRKNQKIYLFVSYIKFKGKILSQLEGGFLIDDFGNSISAIGYNGIAVHKLDFGVKSHILGKHNRNTLNGLLSLGIQKSVKNGFDFYEIYVNGSNYSSNNPIKATAFSNLQIVPAIGIQANFSIYRNFYLNLLLNGFYGFKRIQEMHFEYSFKGGQTEKTLIESSGSGLYIGLGFGYKFNSKNT